MYKDSMYEIEKGRGNFFLMKEGKCVGGLDRRCQRNSSKDGVWEATIQKPYDGESDVLALGRYQDGIDGLNALWLARERAFDGVSIT